MYIGGSVFCDHASLVDLEAKPHTHTCKGAMLCTTMTYSFFIVKVTYISFFRLLWETSLLPLGIYPSTKELLLSAPFPLSLIASLEGGTEVR